MDEILKRDENHVTVLAGVTDDVDQDIVMLRVDPTTKRLLVASSGGGGGGVTSLNTLTGAVTLSAGSNITLTPSGNDIEISSTGGGGSGWGLTGNAGTTAGTNFVGTTDDIDFVTKTSGVERMRIKSSAFSGATGASIYFPVSGNTDFYDINDNVFFGHSGTADSTFFSGGSNGAYISLDSSGVGIQNGTLPFFLRNGIEQRFYEANNSNYVGFKAGTLSANTIWTLPTTDSTGTQALVSNGSGVLSWATISGGGGLSDGDYGDITVSGTGTVMTIDNNVVSLAKMATMATDSILGRATAGTGNVEALTALPFAYTGDVTRPADSNVTTISNNAVTLAQMATMATDSFLGRDTAGTGNVEVLSVATAKTLLNLSGTNTGDETTTTAGALINGATSKTTPVDADYIGLMDSAASNILKKLSWANLKATLVTYFNTLYITRAEEPVLIQVACSDLTTVITAGTSKAYFRCPYAFTLVAVRASLLTGQTGGSLFTVDINDNGSSILSTKITIDNNETTSTTAATAPVISSSSMGDDRIITIDVDTVGTGSPVGLIVTLIGKRTL